jgi:hypothetical protein
MERYDLTRRGPETHLAASGYDDDDGSVVPWILFASLSGRWSPAGSTRHIGHWLAYCSLPGWFWWWSIWLNEDLQGKPKRPSATLFTTNPTWPDPGSDPGSTPGRRGGKNLSCYSVLKVGLLYIVILTMLCSNTTVFPVNEVVPLLDTHNNFPAPLSPRRILKRKNIRTSSYWTNYGIRTYTVDYMKSNFIQLWRHEIQDISSRSLMKPDRAAARSKAVFRNLFLLAAHHEVSMTQHGTPKS